MIFIFLISRSLLQTDPWLERSTFSLSARLELTLVEVFGAGQAWESWSTVEARRLRGTCPLRLVWWWQLWRGRRTSTWRVTHRRHRVRLPIQSSLPIWRFFSPESTLDSLSLTFPKGMLDVLTDKTERDISVDKWDWRSQVLWCKYWRNEKSMCLGRRKNSRGEPGFQIRWINLHALALSRMAYYV